MICACISLKTLTMPCSVRLCLNIHVSVPTLGELRRPGEELTSAVITTTELWWMSLDSSLLRFSFAFISCSFELFITSRCKDCMSCIPMQL